MAYDVETLLALLERVESAAEGDSELNFAVAEILLPEQAEWARRHEKELVAAARANGLTTRDEACRRAALFSVGNFTRSIDAATALIKRVLPGWWWSIGTCCISDDARIAPDYNSPEHGERLKREFPMPAPRQEWMDEFGSVYGPLDGGFDVDRRPAGNPPLAVIEALLHALIYIEETRADAAIPAAVTMTKGG